ncbi:MAG: RDD family protein [Lachnospiraceae bacterium]
MFQYSLKDVALYICQVLYFIICTYETGTTFGKRVFHLKVVSAKEERLGLFDIVYRETIGRFLCRRIVRIWLSAGRIGSTEMWTA